MVRLLASTLGDRLTEDIAALIGDFGMPGDDHDLVPIFKIADPGLGRTITDRFQNDE